MGSEEISNIIKQYIDEADMQVVQKISSEFMNMQTKILEHSATTLESHRQLMIKYFENVKTEIDCKLKLSEDTIAGIAEKKIHEVVNGSLIKINNKLDSITTWQGEHDQDEHNQDEEMRKLIDKVYSKTLYGTLQINLDKHPLRTGIFFLLVIGICVSALFKIYDADMLDLIEYIFKLF